MSFRVCQIGFQNTASVLKTAAFLSLFAGVFLNKACAASPPSQTKINWQTDLKKAHAESVKLNRPMLLVFGADWCTYCRKMEKTTLSTPLLISYVNHSFVPVQLDLEKDRNVAKILGVNRVPCTVVLSPRADLLGRLVGFVDWPKYRDALSQVRVLHRQLDQKQREASRIQPDPAGSSRLPRRNHCPNFFRGRKSANRPVQRNSSEPVGGPAVLLLIRPRHATNGMDVAASV